MDFDEGGRDSEWNEAQFKSIRLHNIQQAINYFKLEPLKLSEGKLNYELWYRNVFLLRGEGYSKYKKAEREMVKRVEKVCKYLLENKPAHKMVMQSDMQGNKQKFIIDKDNYNNIVDMINLYEDLIRDLNDEHGLTTKNVEEEGGWD